MKAKVTVTFEFEVRPPETLRVEVEAGGPHTIAARAIREARRQLKPVNWVSLVCVVERVRRGDDRERAAVVESRNAGASGRDGSALGRGGGEGGADVEP